MSSEAYVLVSKHSQARGLDYLVLLMTTEFACSEDERATFFNVEDLARVTRLSVAETEHVLARLQQQGELQAAPGSINGKPFWVICCAVTANYKPGGARG